MITAKSDNGRVVITTPERRGETCDRYIDLSAAKHLRDELTAAINACESRELGKEQFPTVVHTGAGEVPIPKTFYIAALAYCPFLNKLSRRPWESLKDKPPLPYGTPVFVKFVTSDMPGIESYCVAFAVKQRRGKAKWYGITHSLQTPAELRGVVAFAYPVGRLLL